jgi:hypothetical protein
MDQLPFDYLFRRHSPETVRRWVNALRYGYYVRAAGGHANDGDEFWINLKYTDDRDLDDIATRLHLAKKEGITTIDGTPVYAALFQGYLQLFFSGTEAPYEVSETDFENCMKAEATIEKTGLAAKVSRHLEKLTTCISKERYAGLL